MPVYEYKGVHYELPEGLSNEQALAKIKAHVTKQPINQKEVLKKQGSSAIGVGETALSMLTGGLAQPIAGLAGLGSSIFQGGEKGGQTVRDIQEALTYQPRGEKGKQYTENVGEFFAAPIKAAGVGGEAIGGNAGRAIAEATTEIAMNLLPFGIPKAARMAGSKSRGRVTPQSDPVAALDADLKPPVASSVAVPEQMELDLTTSPQAIAEMQARQIGQRDLFAPVNEPLASVVPETAPRVAPNPLETIAQNELFDQPEQGLVSNPYAANMGDWRVDENGMPIRADLSMELQNLQNPLQRNLFGDELQPRVDPIGQSADLFDSQRQFNEQGVQGGIPLTQAMDSMEPNAMRAAVEQTQMGRELPASPELQDALMQAENQPMGPRNPSMFVPQSQRGAIGWGDKKSQGFLDKLNPFSRTARQAVINTTVVDLAEQMKGSFPETASLFNRPDVKEIVNDIVDSKNVDDPINYWMEKLAGVTVKEDPTLGGQLRRYGPNTWGGQAKSAQDFIKFNLNEDQKAELTDFANTIIQLRNEVDKTVKSVPEPRQPDGDSFNWAGGKDPYFHDKRMENPAYAKEYARFEKEIDAWNKRANIVNDKFQKQYGFRPDGFSKELLEYGTPEDVIWSLIHGTADTIYAKESKQKLAYGLKGYIPKSQRGAIDLGNGTENSNTKKRIAALDLTSPEVQEAKNQIALDNKKNIIAQVPGIGIEGYRNNIDTPEKVIASAPQAKDITKFQRIRGETVSPGINNLVINTNNPLLKFVRGKTRGVFLESEALARLYITDKATGIGTVLNKMTQQEKNQMVAVLQKGDKAQQYITREQMQKAGFSENVMTAVEKFYEMDRKKLEVWNDARAKVGMEPVTERPGHFPGVFKGDYKQLVLVDGKVKGVIAVDTKVQLAKARAKMQEQFPTAKFSTVHRNALGGNGRKSDMFSGMNDVLTMLARNDPEFAKVQELIQTAVKENADALYGAAVHSMAKKGVVGNAGNKPWQDVNTNTNEAIKAYLEYWEEGIISHKNLVVETEIKGLMDNPALDHMPNAKEYVNSYIKNMTGRDIGTIGDALNKLLDAPFKATGLGPTIPREIVNQLNKRLGQHTMGWFNWMFTAIQYLQVPQMALPEMVKIARDLNIPMAKDVSTSMTAALLDLTKEKISGEGSPLIKEAIAEAEKRGLGVFSEYQDINKVTQNKYSKMYDDLIDLNRSLPERQTRPLVFYSFVKMLENSGMSKAEIFEVAHNATQRSMVDYSPRERPMMYQRLGVIGQLAGSLQTFKHAQLSQLSSFASRGDVTALATASLVLLALTGIKGFPAYQELDQLYQYLSDKFFNDRRTIADTVLKDLPEWMKSGAASVATDINVQGRFSAANVVPDTLAEAAMPLGSVLARQGEAAWNLATKQDPLAMNEFLRHMAPSGPIKGMVETTFNVDEDGTPIDKKGLKGNPRTEWDTLVKRTGAGTSLPEALRSEKQWNQMQRERANKDSQKSIVEKANRAAAQGLLTPELQQELITKYVEREGDPQQFINAMVEYQKILQLNKQQRLEGIPNGSLPSVNRYRNYQE